MPEWLVEEGIGEHRAILWDGSEVLAARLDWPGGLAAGQIEDAVLIARAAGSPRGTARFASGEEVLVGGLPRDAREGAAIRLEVTRAAMWQGYRLKRAQARPVQAPPRPAPTLAERLGAQVVRQFDGWEEVWLEALSGTVEFAGGALVVELTAACTAIDIDGTLAPPKLALAAVPAIAGAIRRLDLAGSIVIDFPTIPDKVARKAVDAALAHALADWPHERAAMNGFGLVHLVARRESPSLLELLDRRPDAIARMLLRRAERVTAPGALLLTANARVKAAFHSGWESELARRTGREVRWQFDDALAPHAAFAQAIAP